MSKKSQNLQFLPQTQDQKLKTQGFILKLKPKNSISDIFKIDGYLQSALKKAFPKPKVKLFIRYVTNSIILVCKRKFNLKTLTTC